MAFMPIPPTPQTMTTSPGRTFAELTAAPHPVGTPQLVRHAATRSVSGDTFTADMTDTVERSLKVDSPAICPTGLPSKDSRLLPSSRAPESTRAPLSQRFCRPDAHHLQTPHA